MAGLEGDGVGPGKRQREEETTEGQRWVSITAALVMLCSHLILKRGPQGTQCTQLANTEGEHHSPGLCKPH